MGRFMINQSALLAANPEYAEALARGESWALKHAGQVDSFNSGEPEGMRRKFDGKPRKWCGGSCPHKNGCVTCTLEDRPEIARQHRGLNWED